MSNFVEWVISLPWYVLASVYVGFGVLFGINARFWFARHLARHGVETRQNLRNISCWCEPPNTLGDLVSGAPYFSLFVWPLVLGVGTIVTIVVLYSKVLGLFHSFAQKGVKKTLMEKRTIKDLEWSLQSEKAKVDQLAKKIIDINLEHKKCMDEAQASLAQLTKAAVDAQAELAKYKEMASASLTDLGMPLEEWFKKRTGRDLDQDLSKED